MTTRQRAHWPDDVIHIPWRMDVRKWTSYVKAFESYCITAWLRMHLVRRAHFTSPDKDGSHTIESAISENTMLHEISFLITLSFTKPKLWRMEVYIAGIRIFHVFVPVTLTRWPSYMNFIRTFGRYIRCANMNFVHWQLSLYSYADRQTSCVWSLPVTWQRWRWQFDLP